MAPRKNVSQPVSAKVIRTAFAEGKFTAPDVALPSLQGNPGKALRGRLHPEAIKAAASIGLVYETGTGAVKTITLPVTVKSKSGATLKRPVEVSLSEFRRLSGTTKGRPSAAALETAAANFVKESAKA